MSSRNGVKLALAIALVFSLLAVIGVTSKIGRTASANPLKGTLIRPKGHTKDRLSPRDLDRLRKQLQAKEKEQRVFEDVIPKHLPIKAKLKSDSEPAARDLGNDYWLRDLEIEVKNTGTRPIYYLVLLIDLPEVKINDGNLIFRLQFGDDKFMNFATGATSEDLSLKPGETCLLALRGDDKNLSWHAAGKKYNWPVPKKVRLLFQEISFGDGTGFRTGGGIAWPPQKPSQPTARVGGPGAVTDLARTNAATPLKNETDRVYWKMRFGGLPASYLPAKFSSDLAGVSFLGSVESCLEPDDCCPSGCSWIREYDDPDACFGNVEPYTCNSIHRAEYLYCWDSRGHCSTYEVKYQKCLIEGENGTVTEHWCPYAFTEACTSSGPPTPTPTPTPTPKPSPTPRPSPTPTPCPGGYFDPDQNGDCPYNANKVNGCCLCKQRKTDCSSFGQGKWPNGGDYCVWVESLCDCYNIDGLCADNPRPTPTPDGAGGAENPQYRWDCVDYWWVNFVSYDGGQTWYYADNETYAGTYCYQPPV